MESNNSCPPVMICGFNRPQYLKQVFDQVAKAQPPVLLLVLDAPRDGHPNDMTGYEACRKIFEAIDWPCEVHRNYAEKNMGCRDRMSSAIAWTFSIVDRAIILEDDVVPEQTFFRYCGELLEKYKDDMRVGMIAGHDEHLHLKKLNFYGDSYYFDRMISISGWATWRRAWQMHDPAISWMPELAKRMDVFSGLFQGKVHAKRFGASGLKIYQGEKGAWAQRWLFTMFKENWLCIHPTVNQISHIGVRSSRAGDARRSPFDNRPRVPMKFPLVHPLTMTPRVDSEYYYFIDLCGYNRQLKKIITFPWRAIKFVFRKIRAACE